MKTAVIFIGNSGKNTRFLQEITGSGTGTIKRYGFKNGK